MENNRDEKLWRVAAKRAAFKKSLFGYLVVNAFLWGIWWVTIGRSQGYHGYPWPVWVMMGWGLGLAFQYYEAYHGSRQDMAEEEYERLKRENQQ